MKSPFNQTALILLTSISFLSFTTVTDDPKDRLNVKGPLILVISLLKLHGPPIQKKTIISRNICQMVKSLDKTEMWFSKNKASNYSSSLIVKYFLGTCSKIIASKRLSVFRVKT